MRHGTDIPTYARHIPAATLTLRALARDDAPLDPIITPYRLCLIVSSDPIRALVPDPAERDTLTRLFIRSTLSSAAALSNTAALVAFVARASTLFTMDELPAGDGPRRAIAMIVCDALSIDFVHADTVLRLLTSGDILPAADAAAANFTRTHVLREAPSGSEGGVEGRVAADLVHVLTGIAMRLRREAMAAEGSGDVLRLFTRSGVFAALAVEVAAAA